MEFPCAANLVAIFACSFSATSECAGVHQSWRSVPVDYRVHTAPRAWCAKAAIPCERCRDCRVGWDSHTMMMWRNWPRVKAFWQLRWIATSLAYVLEWGPSKCTLKLKPIVLDPTNRTAATPYQVLSIDPSVKTQRSSGPAEDRCVCIR